MSNEIDANKIAAEVIIQATNQAISAASDPIKRRLRKLFQAISDAYSPFLEKTFSRVSTIRTFLKPTESVDLLNHYVPVDLTNKEHDIKVDALISGLAAGERYVVSGLAGRGKSVLMKFIALSLYHAPQGKIPLFLELRSLNSLTSKSILQLIHSQYKGNANISFTDFTEALEKGYFILLLDGFDEVAPSDRDDIERQIIDISDSYPTTPVVVSGRPYDRFSSWERYTTLHLKPMSIKQTRELIQSSTYDEEVKKIFLKRLDDNFFDKHESFLNTPLLAIMLMLTFEEYAEIPTSLHEFYRNAFDTLLRRHDAMKAQFLRITHSGCTAEDVKKVFSAFCILTYSKSAFTFDKEQILDFIKIAIKQQRIKLSADKFLKDMIESICLLQEEGFEISFVHRSFQEYFCALFVSTSPAGLVEKYLNSGRFRVYDDVLPMLYGMVPGRVEEEWANGIVKDICEKYPKDDPDSAWKFVIEMYPVIELIDSRSAALVEMGPLHQPVSILQRFYPAHFEGTKPPRPSRSKLEKRTADVEAEIRRLMEDGDLEFRGFRFDQKGPRNEGSRRVKLSSSHSKFIEIFFEGLASANLSALRAIHTEQKSRSRGGDLFLKEVFSI